MLYSDIAPVNLARYAGRVVVPGAADLGTSSSQRGPNDTKLLVDLHCRFDVLLTRVS